LETHSINTVEKSITSLPKIPLVPLTQDAFAEFGYVVERKQDGKAGISVNQGRGDKKIICENFENLRPSAKVCLSVFHLRPSTLPIEVALLEKHPHSSQAFIPMCPQNSSVEESYYLVMVASGTDTSIPGALKAFKAKASQGIIYHPGVWHYPLAVLKKEQSFSCMVFEDERDPAGNTVESTVTQKVMVH